MYNKRELFQQLQEFYDGKSEVSVQADRYNYWFRYLHYLYNKVHIGKWNILAVTVGMPRVGKSLFTAFSCFLLNKHFEMGEDIVYGDKGFSNRIGRIKKIGETIIWDEAGVGMNAREFWSVSNREISKMLMTVGHLRPIIFFVTPDLSFIDSQPKKLFHYYFECTSRTAEYTFVKPYGLRVF